MPDQREDTRRTPLSGSTNAAAFTTGAGADAGRGRQAAAPWYIPWNGWKDIFLRTYQQVNAMINRVIREACKTLLVKRRFH